MAPPPQHGTGQGRSSPVAVGWRLFRLLQVQAVFGGMPADLAAGEETGRCCDPRGRHRSAVPTAGLGLGLAGRPTVAVDGTREIAVDSSVDTAVDNFVENLGLVMAIFHRIAFAHRSGRRLWATAPPECPPHVSRETTPNRTEDPIDRRNCLVWADLLSSFESVLHFPCLEALPIAPRRWRSACGLWSGPASGSCR